jgi:hypothetical protein
MLSVTRSSALDHLIAGLALRVVTRVGAGLSLDLSDFIDIPNADALSVADAVGLVV